jgi:membrane associated rhomboid family serine protease
MNIRTRALLDTVLYIACLLMIGLGSYYLLDRLGMTGFYIIVGAFAATGAYIVYSINLVTHRHRQLDKN